MTYAVATVEFEGMGIAVLSGHLVNGKLVNHKNKNLRVTPKEVLATYENRSAFKIAEAQTNYFAELKKLETF